MQSLIYFKLFTYLVIMIWLILHHRIDKWLFFKFIYFFLEH